MKKLISEYINNNSFKSTGYKLFMRNETSHTQFTKTDLVIIREIKEDGLIVEMPSNICQKGHNLTLFFFNADASIKGKLPQIGPFKEALMEVMAKVEKIEENPAAKKMVFVDMNFTQIDVKQWKKILEKYKKAQEVKDKMLSDQHLIRDKK